MKRVFRAKSKPWSKKILNELKVAVATIVENDPENSINANKQSSIENLIESLESKLK